MPPEIVPTVQLNVLGVLAVKEILVVLPLQIWAVLAVVITGVGLTVIVKLWDGPGHPLAVGVTVMVAITGDEPVLMAVKAGMFPLPLAASPMEVVLLVHE